LADPREQLVVKIDHLCTAVVRLLRTHSQQENVVAVEASIRGLQVAKRSYQQRRGDEQDDGRGHLEDEQAPRGPEPPLAATRRRSLHHAIRIDGRSAQCRQRSEQNAAEQRDRGGEAENANIQSNPHHSVGIDWQQRRQHRLYRERDDQATRAADGTEQQAFSQELTEDAPAAGAEREARADLGGAGGRACEQQVRDIHAPDEQQYAKRGGEQRQRSGQHQLQSPVAGAHAADVRLQPQKVLLLQWRPVLDPGPLLVERACERARQRCAGLVQ
jgi:hypothetical protein